MSTTKGHGPARGSSAPKRTAQLRIAILKRGFRYQSDLARAAGVSPATITRMCQGAWPSQDVAAVVAGELGISVDALERLVFGSRRSPPAPVRARKLNRSALAS